jgi:glucose-1-phosphate thymidylyltransferase
MDYVIDRMRFAGCDEIRVVTRRGKPDVIRHARRSGVVAVEGSPGTVCESILLGARGLTAADVVLVGLPDTVWEPEDGYSKLVAELEGAEVVLGLFRAAPQDLVRSDVVSMDAGGRVRRVAVKPARPCSELVWGCWASRRKVLDTLGAYGEPGSWLDGLAAAGCVRGIYLSDSWLDIGTQEALKTAGAR